MKKKYHSYNQQKLKILCDKLCDEIEPLLNYFGIEYKLSSKMISMSCPIHGGDNPSALNLYPEGDRYRGNWKCRTHHCEEIFKSSIIGFIRGVLSKNEHNWSKDGDDCSSFSDAVIFAQKFLNQNLDDIKIDKKHLEKNKFINTIQYINPNNVSSTAAITRPLIKKLLNIPSKYFIDRGFSKDILIKYDVGDCESSNKEMSGRAVVPIYDTDYTFMIGCSGRSVYEKCGICKAFHNDVCPKESDLWKHSKWKHSKNFKTQECLYNYWFAKDFINKQKFVILVESPGNVWRLEEAGIHNSVAILGSSLSDKQKMLLDTSGAMAIVTIMDNDDAGSKAAEQIKKKCNRTYNVFSINIQYEDVASMSIEDIKSVILPSIDSLNI